MARPSTGGLWIERLEFEECLLLLESASIGRVGVSVDVLPVVLPRQLRRSQGVDRLPLDGRYQAFMALDGTAVTFEVDDYEPSADRGWSVLVQGLNDHFISVEMKTVTGRRIRPRCD